MRTYFGVNYIAPIDILVPKEYESIGNDVKTAIENLNINTNLEVLDSAADVTERMNAGTYNIALTTMSDEGDASVFDNGQSVFHFENGDAQQLTPMPWPRPTTTIIRPACAITRAPSAKTRPATGCTRARASLPFPMGCRGIRRI